MTNDLLDFLSTRPTDKEIVDEARARLARADIERANHTTLMKMVGNPVVHQEENAHEIPEPSVETPFDEKVFKGIYVKRALVQYRNDLFREERMLDMLRTYGSSRDENKRAAFSRFLMFLRYANNKIPNLVRNLDRGLHTYAEIRQRLTEEGINLPEFDQYLMQITTQPDKLSLPHIVKSIDGAVSPFLVYARDRFARSRIVAVRSFEAIKEKLVPTLDDRHVSHVAPDQVEPHAQWLGYCLRTVKEIAKPIKNLDNLVYQT